MNPPAFVFRVAALFVVDLLVPDLIPFMDEILLALGTLLLAGLRKRREPPLAPDTGSIEPIGRAIGGQP